MLDAWLVHFCIVFTAAALATCYLPAVRLPKMVFAVTLPLSTHFIATAVVWLGVNGDARGLIAPAVGLLIAVPFFRLRSFSVPGRYLIASQLTLSAVALVWGFHYVWTLEISTVTRVLMMLGLPLMLVMLPFGVLAAVPQWEVLARERWTRPRSACRPVPRAKYPKVSLQVPICSEPPEVVLDTLSSLAALEYPNFEVLVIDNNTKDESLWRPVQQWCERDPRFRFFHLADCPGAKAGALNFVHQFMADDTTIIGLIDSDYQAQPTFLSALIGHFDDPGIGFVQSPHDYREWEHSVYQRMCYWEYRSFFTICVPSWNERGAAITVGTMSLIRRAALEEAGGWSEWCLTEDSELAPRIHALGYRSVYVQQSFGKGLIPETFGGYAKQRRRWTYGPIQELKAHLPMFAPGRLGRRTALTAGQKLFHLHHDLDPLFSGLGLLLTPIGLATTFSMVIQHERPALSWLVIGAGMCVGLSSTLVGWCVWRRAMGCSLLDVFLAGVAKSALGHSIGAASLRASCGIPLSWQRTDKFKARSEGVRRALHDTRVEIGMAGLLMLMGLLALQTRPTGLPLLLVIGIVMQGIGYLTAPAVALVAEWDLRRTADVTQPVRSDAKAVA
jgi:cellulose synthase/poly-beta-1,6-N-acetylglucosamine synthase-like glycosyltransferase